VDRLSQSPRLRAAFMRDFPDMVVTFDKLENTRTGTEFHWTFTGTNTGPGGTGNPVRISGYELWKNDKDGLISESKGHFDAAEYERSCTARYKTEITGSH
jgi:hypothetical protein